MQQPTGGVMPSSRTTRFAYAVAGTLMTASTVLGLAALFELPVFGFATRSEAVAGPAPVEAPTATTADPPTTTVATPQDDTVIVIEQIRYVDEYVMRRDPAAEVTSASTASPTEPPAPTTLPPAPTSPTAAPTTASPPTSSGPTTTLAPAPTSTVPPPPAGCDEPEWDNDRRRWHCKGD
jgi:hypothetical protein